MQAIETKLDNKIATLFTEVKTLIHSLLPVKQPHQQPPSQTLNTPQIQPMMHHIQPQYPQTSSIQKQQAAQIQGMNIIYHSTTK